MNIPKVLIPETRPPQVKEVSWRKNGKFWRGRADLIWGLSIHDIYPQCPVVGHGDCSRQLDAHHLISRELGSTRHCIENGIILCASHHTISNTMSAHGAPLAFADWMQDNRRDQYDWVRARKHQIGKYNYKEAAVRLNDIWETVRSVRPEIVWGIDGITFD